VNLFLHIPHSFPLVNELPKFFHPLFQQRAFTPIAYIIVYIAQGGTGVTEYNAVLGFIIFLIGIKSPMVTNLIAYLKKIVTYIIILCGQPMILSSIITDNNNIFRVMLDAIIIVTTALMTAFLIHSFINHNAIPSCTSFPSHDGNQSNYQKYTPNYNPNIKGLRIIHFPTNLNSNIKSNDGNNR
jgi:hypothetical protein